MTAPRLPGQKQHKMGAVSATLDLAASQIGGWTRIAVLAGKSQFQAKEDNAGLINPA